MNRPLCFVLMPFGKKPDAAGMMIDFDVIYKKLIAPAINEAGLEPLRADEEVAGGIIQKPMFERLILCEYAIADLTTANANVFYELGVRHAVRPWTTVTVFYSGGARLPFDVADLRALPYKLSNEGVPADIVNDKAAMVKRLLGARKVKDKPLTDSPIFQLVDGLPEIKITSDKTDVFREQVRYSTEVKARLETARKQGVDAVRTVERELSESEYKEINGIKDQESGVVIDLFLSYRAVNAWNDMIALVDKMSRPLATTVMVQEQLALALNRAGQGEKAEKVLTDLIERRGPSSETYGLLGRVYKDRWEAAQKSGDKFTAPRLLEKAIDAYLRGFEADWRDAYPGVNVATLMELKEPSDPRRNKIIPVVAYAVDRRIAAGKPDYWDYATRLELAILAKDERMAKESLGDALTLVRESWEPETTARNLRLIREARERRQDTVTWTKEIEEALECKAKK